MRLRKADLRSRINGELAIRHETGGLTSFAGLELIRQFFRRIGFVAKLRREVARKLPGGDYGAVAMTLLVIALLVTGGRRVRHARYLESDAMVKRFCSVNRVPTPRTIGRWLRGFDSAGVDALLRLNEWLSGQMIEGSGVRRLTLDVDGSVVSTGLQVEGAERGYNPHRRKVPSYYPITAYEANTGQVLRVRNRAGNVHDGKASVPFLKELFAQLHTTLQGRYVLEMRMDGAFFRRDVFELLDAEGVEYALKVPFYQWLGLTQAIAKRRRWRRVDRTVESFELRLAVTPWKRRERVVIYRKKVGHFTRKNYQLDLFDPDDGHYEYSAVATNKTISPRTLWYFMCGRGTHEKVYGELKSGFAFACVPTQHFEANSAWQVLSIMAFNLMRGFQAKTGAEQRRTNRKRRAIHRFDLIHTLRYEFLNRAGLLVNPGGRATLDVGDNQMVRDRFASLNSALTAA